MLIYLLRHGDAAQDPSLHDSERPLTQLGLRQAEAVARFLRRMRIAINVVLSSPLQRAMQTAQPTIQLLHVPRSASTEFLVPGSNPKHLIDEINANDVESILLVGHEPLLGQFLSLLTVGTTELRTDFKKSTLALVETPSPVRKGAGMLKWIAPYEQMDEENLWNS